MNTIKVQKKAGHYQSYKLTLYREVNANIRYYTFRIYPTLFGEYVLEKEFGGLKNKRFTGIIKEYYSQIEMSIHALKKYEIEKLRKGYTGIIPDRFFNDTRAPETSQRTF